jgi:hypothetical protein
MSPAMEDEGLHPATDDADWQESVYFAWRDAASGLGGNHRIGNEVNRGTANLWCGVYHQDGTRFRHNDQDLALQRVEGHGVGAGPQRLFHDGERLRFVLDADGCQMDLVLEDEADSFSVSGADTFTGSKGSAGAIFSNNFHASCRAEGSVTFDGRTVEVTASAWRDHSWGVRHWDSFLSSRSFGGSFGDSLQFRYGSMVGANGSFFRQGSLSEHGKKLEVASAAMLLHVDDDSLRCPSAEVEYRLVDGGTVHVRIEAIGGMLGVTRRRYGWESVGDVWVDGEPGGWGFLEANINPRNGDAPPTFALGDALVNGVTRTVP